MIGLALPPSLESRRSILACGKPALRARAMTSRRSAFAFGSGPPPFTALAISALNLVNAAPFLASTSSLRRLMLCHLECQDIVVAYCLNAGTLHNAVASIRKVPY